jgi:hypothetical protein
MTRNRRRLIATVGSLAAAGGFVLLAQPASANITWKPPTKTNITWTAPNITWTAPSTGVNITWDATP